VSSRKKEFMEAVEPTQHPPGSEGKIRILALRVKYDLPLRVKGDSSIPMHPHDKRFNPLYEEGKDDFDSDTDADTDDI
jgi:hypothetical protein